MPGGGEKSTLTPFTVNGFCGLDDRSVPAPVPFGTRTRDPHGFGKPMPFPTMIAQLELFAVKFGSPQPNTIPLHSTTPFEASGHTCTVRVFGTENRVT
jgi:hypothetical protein